MLRTKRRAPRCNAVMSTSTRTFITRSPVGLPSSLSVMMMVLLEDAQQHLRPNMRHARQAEVIAAVIQSRRVGDIRYPCVGALLREVRHVKDGQLEPRRPLLKGAVPDALRVLDLIERPLSPCPCV